MKHDEHMEKRIAQAFESVADALIQILSASRQTEWGIRHKAAEALGEAAAGVYAALCEEGVQPAS